MHIGGHRWGIGQRGANRLTVGRVLDIQPRRTRRDGPIGRAHLPTAPDLGTGNSDT
jgi:hypothetical protein